MPFARSALVCVLVLSGGCAQTTAAPRELARAAVGHRDTATRAEPATVAATPPLAGTPQNATSPEQHAQQELQLQARNDREQKAYQIAQLRRAIALYQQFLERAGEEPEYALAARRSREQIQDAQAIIELLEQPPETSP